MALLPIEHVAKRIGLDKDDLTLYGRYKAKVDHRLLGRLAGRKDGKLILVTAITPTPAGEGKTTTTIGLGEAFSDIGKKAIACIRQPSLGPVFGMKGGATGGGCSRAEPANDINLHFTGDMHAVSAANNLLAAMIDNHIEQGNRLGIDLGRISWKRAMDMNDRALREIEISPHGSLSKASYRTGFDITAASEVMAILSLATGMDDLEKRLGRIIAAYGKSGRPVYARDLKAHRAMSALLAEAINPNLVQSTENTPLFVHGGPFANIAHGCSSLLATKLALKLADYVITEAGFGSDLGAEKFFDIKCRAGRLRPGCVVLVATIRALKEHGGVPIEKVMEGNPEAVEKGLENLDAHMDSIRQFGLPLVVAINKFRTDTSEECGIVEAHVKRRGGIAVVEEVFEKCGPGGEGLARAILKAMGKKSSFSFLYKASDSVEQKILRIATRVYGAEGVEYSTQVRERLKQIEKLGFSNLPVCIAKTQYSLSDDPKKLGRPKGFKVTVRDLHVSSGAGFIVAYMGSIMTMPGLPARPAAEHIGVGKDGNVVGIG